MSEQKSMVRSASQSFLHTVVSSPSSSSATAALLLATPTAAAAQTSSTSRSAAIVRGQPETIARYKCKLCDAVCNKPSVLEKHMRKHTNERPFPCKLCARSFKTKSNLTKHEKSKSHNHKSVLRSSKMPNTAKKASILLTAIDGKEVEFDSIDHGSSNTQSDVGSVVEEHLSGEEDDDIEEEISVKKEPHSEPVTNGAGSGSWSLQTDGETATEPPDNKCSGMLTINSAEGPICVEVQINLDTMRHLQHGLTSLSAAAVAVGTASAPHSNTSSPLSNRNDAELRAAESILHMANQPPLFNQHCGLCTSQQQSTVAVAVPTTSTIVIVSTSAAIPETTPSRTLSSSMESPGFNTCHGGISSSNDLKPSIMAFTGHSPGTTHSRNKYSQELYHPVSPLMARSIKPSTPTSLSKGLQSEETAVPEDKAASRKFLVKENLLKKMQKKQHRVPVETQRAATRPHSLLTAGSHTTCSSSNTTSTKSATPTILVFGSTTAAVVVAANSLQSSPSTTSITPSSPHSLLTPHDPNSAAAAAAVVSKVISNTRSLHQHQQYSVEPVAASPLSSSVAQSRLLLLHSSGNTHLPGPVTTSVIPETSAPTSAVKGVLDSVSSNSESELSPCLKIVEDLQADSSTLVTSASRPNAKQPSSTRDVTTIPATVTVSGRQEILQNERPNSNSNPSTSSTSVSGPNLVLVTNVVCPTTSVIAPTNVSRNGNADSEIRHQNHHDNDDTDEEIDVVNTDSGNEDNVYKISDDRKSLVFVGEKQTVKRRHGKEGDERGGKRSKDSEVQSQLPLYNPNINAKDLLQDCPLNLSANRLPTIPLTLLPETSSHASTDSVIRSICQAISCSSPGPPSMPAPSASSTRSCPLSVLTNNHPAHDSLTSSAAAISAAAAAISQPPVPPPPPHLYLFHDQKKRCDVCGQILELSFFKVHMDMHRYTDKDSSQHPTDISSSSGQVQSDSGGVVGGDGGLSATSSMARTASTSNSRAGSSLGGIHSRLGRPRTYRCAVCNVAFRVIGHLRKHHHSKGHLQALVQAGLLTQSLMTRIDALKLPLPKLIDPHTGNIDPESLKRNMPVLTTYQDDNNGLTNPVTKSSSDPPNPLT